MRALTRPLAVAALAASASLAQPAVAGTHRVGEVATISCRQILDFDPVC